MSKLLDLATFVTKDELLNVSWFSDEKITDYLGKNLTKWLEENLSNLGVTDHPVIKGDVSPKATLEGMVYVAEGARIEPEAYVAGPTYIGPGSEVRHGAYIRGSTYVGRDCVVGHVTEVKGSLFLDGAKAGHFAYVGDSILGRDTNLGAGTKLANLRLMGDEVNLQDPDSKASIPTGLRKFGAILGDGAQTGCNSVLNPGALLYPNTGVLACVSFVGTLTKRWAR